MEEICNEIREFGEPANPALGRMLPKALSVLRGNGAVVGLRGSGKSLLAFLAALSEIYGGRPAVVLKADRVVKAAGRVPLADVSNLQSALKCKYLPEWFEKIGLKVGQPADIDNLEIRVEGAGMAKLEDAARQLAERGFFVVVDGFEQLVERPGEYGFGGVGALVEDFYAAVDRWKVPAGFVLPASLWMQFDVQIKSRIAPIYYLHQDIATEDMRVFLRRKLGRDAFPKVEFRNPGAVVQIAEEVKTVGVEGVLWRRLRAMHVVADMYGERRVRNALFWAYVAAWYRQNIYATFEEGDFFPEVRKTLLKARPPLLRKTPGGFELTAVAVEHIRKALKNTEHRNLAVELSID